MQLLDSFPSTPLIFDACVQLPSPWKMATNSVSNPKEPLLTHARATGKLRQQDKKSEAQQAEVTPWMGSLPSPASSPSRWQFKLSQISYTAMPRTSGVGIVILAYVAFICAHMLVPSRSSSPSSAPIVQSASATPPAPIEDTEPVARVTYWEGVPSVRLL